MARVQPYPQFRAFRDDGTPANGWKLYTYIAGTTTPKATFTDQTGTAENTNPVILNGLGEASVWLGAGAYKFVLRDEFDVDVWSVDSLQVPDAGEFASLVVTGASTFAAVTASGQIISTVATGTAPLVISSTTEVANLNAALLKGKNWAAPDNIGLGTPQAGKFTNLEATVDMTVGQKLTVGTSIEHTELRTLNPVTGMPGTWRQGAVSEEITLNTGATTTDSVADMLPATAIIEAVIAEITQAITTAANWSLGDSANAARFLAATTDLALGTKKVGLAHRQPDVLAALGPVQTAKAPLRITTNANPGQGKIKVTVFYSQFLAAEPAPNGFFFPGE